MTAVSDKRCIAFAGVVGSSKTPIATYLSWNLGLPIVSNDALRSEIKQDMGHFDEAEYISRREKRSRLLITSGKSFVYDASVDREWVKLRDELRAGGYESFIISLDLSRELLSELHRVTGYSISSSRLDELLEQHSKFIDTYNNDVNLHITDREFKSRMQVAHDAVLEWL